MLWLTTVYFISFFVRWNGVRSTRGFIATITTGMMLGLDFGQRGRDDNMTSRCDMFVRSKNYRPSAYVLFFDEVVVMVCVGVQTG